MSIELFHRIMIIFVTATCLNAIGLSRLWICGAIGLALPPAIAFPAALVSAVLGNLAIFLVCRSARFRKLLKRPIDAVSRLYARVRLTRVGISGVVAARQLPLPSIAISMLLANTNVSQSNYLLGTALGYLPSTALAIMATGAAAHFMPPHVTTITACVIGIAAGTIWLCKLRRNAE